MDSLFRRKLHGTRIKDGYTKSDNHISYNVQKSTRWVSAGGCGEGLFGQINEADGRLVFSEVYGFAVKGNHFYLLVKMIPEDRFADDEVKRRLEQFYGEDRVVVGDGQLSMIRQKLASLSEFVREIKVNITRLYNKRRGRKGYFWGGRFKSMIVENGETLINCLAYIDLNPARLCPAINRLKFCHRPTRTHTEKGGYPGGDQDAGMSCFLMRSWGGGYLQP